MLQVNQINDYTCLLACLESFLKDSGKDIDQKRILNDIGKFCHIGEKIEGAVDITPENLMEIGDEYEFDVIYPVKNFQPLHNNEAYLIVTTNLLDKGVSHCIRWSGRVNDDLFEIMDPKLTGIPWTSAIIQEAKCLFFHLQNR